MEETISLAICLPCLLYLTLPLRVRLPVLCSFACVDLSAYRIHLHLLLPSLSISLSPFPSLFSSPFNPIIIVIINETPLCHSQASSLRVFEFRISSFELRISSFEFRVFEFRVFELRVFELRASNFELRASSQSLVKFHSTAPDHERLTSLPLPFLLERNMDK